MAAEFAALFGEQAAEAVIECGIMTSGGLDVSIANGI